MTPERHALIKEIFLAAMSSPADEHPAILDRRCGDDQELRREVERLIAHHDDQTITPNSQAATSPADVWRRAGPQLDLRCPGPPSNADAGCCGALHGFVLGRGASRRRE